MTKNGFEIRLELLKMAKEMMEQQYIESSNTYWSAVTNLAETWNKSASELIEQTMAVKPKMYTPDDVMKKAQELYGFVAKKD